MGRIQVDKVVGYESLYDRARFIFEGGGDYKLSRKELRALERKGYVVKYPVWTDGTLKYEWIWWSNGQRYKKGYR